MLFHCAVIFAITHVNAPDHREIPRARPATSISRPEITRDVREIQVQYGARDYDPKTGRWTSKDATRFGGGANFYGYAGDDSVKMVDMAGSWAIVIVNVSNVDITIPVYFFGDGASSENIALVVSQIQNAWTGQFGRFSVVTRVDVRTVDPNDFGGPASCPVSQVPINRIKLSAFKASGPSTVFGHGLDGAWDVDSKSSNTFAHEASHLLGLPDQFTNPKDLTYSPWMRSPSATPSAADISDAIRNRASGITW